MTTQTVLIAVFVLLALPILWALIRFVTWLLSLRVGGYGNIETADGDATEMMEPPAVRGYIEQASGRALPAPFDQIKQLTARLEK